MLTLYLVRHAEPESTHPDFERKLTPYGETQARDLGLALKKRSIQPDQIICSPAVRAFTTARLISEILEQDIQTNPAIYNAPLDTLVDILKTCGTSKSILLVGHNPGISLLVNYLVDTEIDSLSPCELHIIEIPADTWNNLMPHSGKLREL